MKFPVGEAKDCLLCLPFAGLKHFTLLGTYPLKAQALLPLVSLLVKQKYAKLVPDSYLVVNNNIKLEVPWWSFQEMCRHPIPHPTCPFPIQWSIRTVVHQISF